MRVLYIIAGSLFVGLGAVGAVLPGLPTTIFLLLAATCYVRGSQRLYDWLLNHRFFGKYIRSYLEKRGMSRRSKIIALTSMWTMITLSGIFAITGLTGRIILFSAGALGTIILFFVKRVE